MSTANDNAAQIITGVTVSRFRGAWRAVMAVNGGRSYLVSTRGHKQEADANLFAERLTQNLAEGHIRADSARWDDDELEFYFASMSPEPLTAGEFGMACGRVDFWLTSITGCLASEAARDVGKLRSAVAQLETAHAARKSPRLEAERVTLLRRADELMSRRGIAA